MVDIEMLSNLESVGEMIGALKGIENGLEEDAYTEGLIKQAHGKAANAFNVAAAATAKTGAIAHVYEFGVAGITPGNPKFMDPTSPAARLFEHTITGVGGAQDIGYAFRPAFNRNPDPTTESTGVPSKYLAKLSKRKYVFWNKAFVMETGQSVQIKSKQPHGMLFLPFNHEPSYANPPYPNGHVMWDTHAKGLPRSKVPGENVQGNFTAFWIGWWAASGQEIIEQDMRRNIYMDIDKAMAAATTRANASPVKPAETTNILGAAASAASFIKKFFGRKTSKEVI